jgi:hypothetical protein
MRSVLVIGAGAALLYLLVRSKGSNPLDSKMKALGPVHYANWKKASKSGSKTFLVETPTKTGTRYQCYATATGESVSCTPLFQKLALEGCF